MAWGGKLAVPGGGEAAQLHTQGWPVPPRDPQLLTSLLSCLWLELGAAPSCTQERVPGSLQEENHGLLASTSFQSQRVPCTMHSSAAAVGAIVLLALGFQ